MTERVQKAVEMFKKAKDLPCHCFSHVGRPVSWYATIRFAAFANVFGYAFGIWSLREIIHTPSALLLVSVSWWIRWAFILEWHLSLVATDPIVQCRA